MNTQNQLDDWSIRIAQNAKKHTERVERFITSQPQAKNCTKHPGVFLRISLERSLEASRNENKQLKADYEPCPRCESELQETVEKKRLHDQGVPMILLHATLDNWETDHAGVEHRETVRKFSKERKGVLILLGDFGTGKSHLAVGAMRSFSNAHYVKQNDLLRKLRQTYRDHDVSDPVEDCQRCGLLVLDDMGLSGGGRDELPMIHAILDHRHDEQKPTIITSNLELVDLQAHIGGRMADRFKESCFEIIQFRGESHRKIANEKYFSKLR